MKNTKLIRFAQSFILLPAMTMSGVSAGQPVSPVTENNIVMVQEKTLAPQIALIEKLNNKANGIFARNNDKDDEAKLLEEARAMKAEAIETYFKKYDMPLAGTGMKMVLEAEKNDLDWRLLPAIAVRESTGGKFACKKVTHSFFGWGSCKINFSSYEESIDVISQNLGGHNPRTAPYYKGKTLTQVLDAYNPPTIKPNYKKLITKTMEQIATIDADTVLAMK